MKICLIRPAFVTTAGAIGIEVILPLGIAYLAAHLRREGFEVSFVDAVGEDLEAYSPFPELPNGVMRGLPDEETVARIPADVEVIGISCMFSLSWIIARRLIQAVRRRFPKAVLIIGGEHATALAEYCLRDAPEIDFVVLGEGEHTTAELLQTLKEGGDPETVTGVAFLRDGEYRVAPPRARERKLVALSWPAWDMLPIENYLGRVNGGLESGRTMPIIASRGCPYDCTFCSNSVMWGKLWRARPADDVVAEIEHNVRTYNIAAIDFFDLTTIVKRSWIIDFCNLMIERKLNVTWQLITTRSEMIDQEVTELMKKAGCTYVFYAAESGSDRVLTEVRKKVDREAMLRSIGYAVDAGLGVKMNFVAGFPDDRLWDILASYWMAARAAWRGAHDCTFFPFSPYPGSELFRRLLAEGKIVLNDQYFLDLASYNLSHFKSFARHFNEWQLRSVCWTGMAVFYLVGFGRRPSRIWDLFSQIRRAEGKTRLAASLVRVLRKRREIRKAITAQA